MPDIVSGYTWTDGEKGVTATKMNNQFSGAVIQTDFIANKPSSSTLDPTDQLLELKGAGTYARITGSQLISSVSSQVDATPQIYSVRLRSFNAVNNPTFEVNQRLTGGTMQANTSQWITDRWLGYNSTGITPFWGVSTGQTITVPGTNFMISQAMLQFNTQSVSKPSLAATDQTIVQQTVEGSAMRELMNDVHSISILAQTNVAGGLKFALLLQDSSSTRTLAKLCTIPSPNVWTLIQLPNLPVWASGGGWSVTPGSVGYNLIISVAAGSSQITSANDVWVNANVRGAIGMDNILSKPSNSQLWIAAVQDEPGAQCSTLMDVPFSQNYDNCLRYFSKSYLYSVKAGTNTTVGQRTARVSPQFTSNTYDTITFPKTMAKVPTVALYAPDGTVNAAQVLGAANVTVSSVSYIGDNAFSGFAMASAQTANNTMAFHYTADIGW